MNGQLASADRHDSAAPPALLIRLLGSFTVSIHEQPIADDAWRRQKVRALVKLLALAPAQRLARDQLLDMLWPDFAPDAAASNLYSTLTVARKVLAGVATLHLRAGMVALQVPDGVLIDVAEFTQAATRARGSRDPAAYRAALAWYGGELLPDDRYEDWASRPARDAARHLLYSSARRGDFVRSAGRVRRGGRGAGTARRGRDDR